MRRRGNGEGSIVKRKDGRWSAQATVTLASGGTKRVCITTKEYETAKSKLCEILEQEKRNIPCSEKNWTVSDYLDYWMRDIQARRIRETTMALYEMNIRLYIKPTLGGRKLKELSVSNIRGALTVLDERNCSGRTKQIFLQIIRACLNCAMREELIFRNVASLVEKPKYTPKEITIWSVEQSALFLYTIKEHRLYIVFLLLLSYGMRLGEALGLRWSDIDFDNGIIHIRQQIGRINGKITARELKAQNSRRTLSLMKHVGAELMKHAKKEGITPPKFNPRFELSTQGTIATSKTGTPLDQRNLLRTFHKLTKEPGLPRIRIHSMRHTACTIMKDAGVPLKDIQLMSGHANPSTTMNIYIHGTPETQRTATSAVEKRLFSETAT
jgi:integrase